MPAKGSPLFVSYARENVELVTRIVRAIEERLMVSVWTDARIRYGESFTTEIQAALDDAKLVVVFWTAQSIASSFVIDEASRAKEANKLLPVKLEPIPTPLGFGALHTLELYDFSNDRYSEHGKGFDELVKAIVSRLASVNYPFTRILNQVEANDRAIAERFVKGTPVAVVAGASEAVAARPFLWGLAMLGFKVFDVFDPREYSGADMRPVIADLDEAKVVVFTLFPSMTAGWFYDFCRTHTMGKRQVFVAFGSLTRERARERYPFLADVPDNLLFHKSSIGIGLEGEMAIETWELIRVILDLNAAS